MSRALGLLAVAALAACASPREPPARRVVLIVVDTLRADRLEPYGYARPTSPRLDEWARRGRVYERCFATSPWTAPSFGSVLTGELPARHGLSYRETPEGEARFEGLDPSLETLPEVFRDAGWHTAAIVNNPFLAPAFGLDRGFVDYDYAASSNTELRRADEVVRGALERIEAAGEEQRLFLLVHLFDPHLDYDAPPPARGRFTSGIETDWTLPVHRLNEIRGGAVPIDETAAAFIGAAYDEELVFVDGALGRLLDELDRRDFFRDGLVVLTSDHGEELFEHGGFEHGHAMWQELLHVPLVVWGDAVRTGREYAPVSIADLAPTLAEAAGLAFGSRPDGSRSLLANLRGAEAAPSRPVFADENRYGETLRAVIDWPYKLIVNEERGDARVFDLERDPRERLPSSPESAELETGLRRLISERRDRDRRARTASPVDMDPDTERRLRALGYVD